MAEFTAEDQERHQRRLAESNNLMEAARKVLQTFPKQTEALQKDPKAAVPFQLQTAETAQDTVTPALPSPTRTTGGDIDTQARLRQLLSQRFSKIATDTPTSTLKIEPPTQEQDQHEVTITPPKAVDDKPEKEEKP
jgi:hypothetical protein